MIAPKSGATPVRPASALSRTCACGTHTGGGPCEHCRSQNHSRAAVVPRSDEPLSTNVGKPMESQFDTRFDDVSQTAEVGRSARRGDGDPSTVGANIAHSSGVQAHSSLGDEQMDDDVAD